MSMNIAWSPSAIMEKLSGNTEMSDAVADDGRMARSLIEMIAGDAWTGKSAALDAVYDALVRYFPHSNWTRRRVKGLYQGEAAVVGFREMRELAEAALAEQKRHETIRKAREEHAEYIAETARRAALALSRTTDRARAVDARPGGVSG